MKDLDQPRPVRSGEELDLERLGAFLAENGLSGPLSLEQFPGGYSNLTYLVRVGERELVLRRPPRGANIKTAHDMGREYRLLKALHPLYPRAPEPVLACSDESVLGAPFYLMERVRGLILRGAGQPLCTLELMGRLSEGLIDLLAELHGLDWKSLSDLGKPEGYVGRQVTGWCERYRKSQTDDLPDVDRVMDWLTEEMPAQSGIALVHNDFKYDNLVLDPDHPERVLAVLDWEMATLGDPLMDLGTTLGYWVQPSDPEELHALGFGPTFLPGNLSRAQLAQRYAERTGASLEAIHFYYAFGLFKLAVIGQQIYARYKRGLTSDARFARLNLVVRLMGSQALAASARRGLA